MVACFFLGNAYLYSERYEEAILQFEKSLRLSPVPFSWSLRGLAECYRYLGRYDEGIAMYKKFLQVSPKSAAGHVGLAWTYVLAGREEEARAEALEIMRIDPQFSMVRYAKMIPYRQVHIDQMVEALRKAGLK